ncbi:hypothetical protein JOB18_017993 [Solea senegalensis]|uniref:CCHC-type domain-containing protein n=1 Tax=Solea senegalensis TaxID=28829 RepID=A0AAV6PDF9_SOLSE|nr:hypothetical protein JOB18_017993 [Solea senegalensis]
MESWPAVKRCLFCGGGHALEVCFLLEKKAHHEKITFLKENGACFGCLQIGHMSKDCRKRLSCNICNLKHPQMLHIHQRRFEMDKHQAQTKEEADIRAIASVQTSGLTGAGEDNCKLSIVPVKVKAKKGNTTVHTYAFLDPGSTASFCTLGLMTKLNLQGRKSNILLRTMGQKKVVETSIVSGLEVTGLHGTDFCDLPCVYTQKTMPVHKGNIPHQNDINQWHHLKNIHLPELDCEIELLIGSDVPKALEPLQVIRSVGDGPYAIETMLGWTVNGPLGGKDDYAQEQSEIRVNRISVVALDEQWEQQFKIDFPECVKDDQEPSKEDQQFLDLVSTSAKLVNGHYCFGLPLKDREICLPDNKNCAEQRALNLKRRFQRAPTTNFIHYFSSWNQLKRAVAWMLRIKGLLLQRIRKRKTASGVLSLQGNLDTHEIRLTIGMMGANDVGDIRESAMHQPDEPLVVVTQCGQVCLVNTGLPYTL